MSSNIYWTCPTCGAQLPGETVACPRCEKAKKKAAKVAAKAMPKAASKAQPMALPAAAAKPDEGSFSQHPELYEWEARREAEGRDRMRTSAGWAFLIGLLFGGLVYVLTEQADEQARIGATAVAAALIGFAYYRWSHDSGFQMVVEAQRALVAIETEQNTREIARLLREANSEAEPAEDSEPEPPSQSANEGLP